MNNKYKYLLFDNDGTLMDFKKSEEYALECAYKQSGAEKYRRYDSDVLEIYSKINDSWWKKLERKECTKEELMQGRFKDFLDALDIKDIDYKSMSESYPLCLSLGHFLFEGAKELLKELSKHYSIYIITNGIGFVQRKRVKECEYLPYIKGLFISEEIGAVKPEKEYFSYVLKMLNAEKEDCLIIGDSLTADIKGGNLYGIDTLWFNPENIENNTDVLPNYTFSSYSDILSFLL